MVFSKKSYFEELFRILKELFYTQIYPVFLIDFQR